MSQERRLWWVLAITSAAHDSEESVNNSRPNTRYQPDWIRLPLSSFARHFR